MSDEQKDLASRWLPTIIAIIAIAGNVLWLGSRAGALEQRLIYVETSASVAVTRAEYLADKSASTASLNEVKQSLRDISNKLDRLAERPR
jgi:hypothetical protein